MMAPLVVEKRPRPKTVAPISLAARRKLPLYFVGQTALRLARQIADGQFRRDGYERMNVIA